MKYRLLGKTGVSVSEIGLGGHEFGPDGFIRGFHDDPVKSIKADFIVPGFGGSNREEIVRTAYDKGINIFDLTIDSEKEAMGRILKKIPPPYEILIQTRPEGMVYTYDPANKKMKDYGLLRAEVVRALGLLGRERIDIYNFGFMAQALEEDPDYISIIGDNITRLKKEGLIRFASADTFSGTSLYLAQIRSGFFDSMFINYNVTEVAAEEVIIPEAAKQKMGVLTREPFAKARIFAMAEKIGFADRSFVASACLKWMLQNSALSSVVMGVLDATQLKINCVAAESPSSSEESGFIKKLCASPDCSGEREQKRSL